LYYRMYELCALIVEPVPKVSERHVNYKNNES
jgi:hypothetical protein